MAGRKLRGPDAGARLGAVVGRLVLVLLAVASVLVWSGPPARATDYPNTPGSPTICLQVPKDLQGVLFRIYCPGQIAFDMSNDADGCNGSSSDVHYQNIPDGDPFNALHNLKPPWCKAGDASFLDHWLLEGKHKKNGHPDPGRIEENPCDAIPKDNRAGCADIRQSKYQDLNTHPCLWKNPATGKPILEVEKQSYCLQDNPWFTDGYKPPGRGDKNAYDASDYSAPPEVSGPLMEGAGWVSWACLVGCFFSSFWLLFQFVGARRSGTEMAHGTIYVFVGTLIVGSASSIVQFVIIA
ncbi:hypothetical protein ACWGR4_28160 [Embleya sp. NPDC055664]